MRALMTASRDLQGEDYTPHTAVEEDNRFGTEGSPGINTPRILSLNHTP